MKVTISAKEAKAAGLKKYFTGKPCKRGHISERRTINLSCCDCVRAQSLARSRLPHVKKMNSENKNTERYRAQQSEYARSPEVRARNRELSRRPHQQAKVKNYRESRTEINRAYMRSYYSENREALLAYAKEMASRPEAKVARKDYIREWSKRYRKTPEGAATFAMRKMIHRCLISKTDRTVKLMGYRPSDLVAHIENLFAHGMTWANHGEWHIDHKKPIAAFLKEGVTCAQTINALSNLQPLWAQENLSKGSSFEP